MGMFLLAERATWYLGGESSIWGSVGELDFGTFAAFEDVGKVFLGLSVCERFEGRLGCGAGGCALSASVAASAAARSAARAGEGASGDDLEASEGVAVEGGGDRVLEAGATGPAMY
jgi:hypothetical protein